MTVPTGSNWRTGILLKWAPIAGGVTAFALAIVASLAMVGGGGRSAEAPATDGPTASESFATAPGADVELVHAALHDIGNRCRPGADADAQRRLGRDVDLILTFAQRYPEARFPIDDETGRSLSLLLATRDDLRGCAPALAARVGGAIPAPFQDRPPTP